ncbi:MAG: OprO/OprP family phosphate-selective porin, partial [Rhodothermia bacterium]|nr:OprO/OprP family phosphate-selective porin [Rhodothermia bacterium]
MTLRLRNLVRVAGTAVLIAAFGVLFPSSASAQDDAGEPEFDRLEQFLKRGYFNAGVVIQTVGDFIWDRDALPGHNGFSIATSRLKVDGGLDFGLGYLFQTDFARSPSLIDARLSYRISPELKLDAGLFKAPFSAEQLIAAPSIDFVNRSQVVNILSPGRQVGVSLSGRAS